MSTTITTKKIGQIEVIHIENEYANANISLFGAHVMSFIPKSDNRDRLWMSSEAIYDGKAPLRGGIPICWPWFSDRYPEANADLPAHGYVRDQNWTLVSTEDTFEGTLLVLHPGHSVGPGFPYKTALQVTILVGQSLKISVVTTNLENKDIRLTGALHTYFAVSDISDVILHGITGHYFDKTRKYQQFNTPKHYEFDEETDRVHQCKANHITINFDKKVTEVNSQGHDSIVVWNPWAANSESMKDMPDDGYRHMLCVETAITDGIALSQQQSHALVQTIK